MISIDGISGIAIMAMIISGSIIIGIHIGKLAVKKGTFHLHYTSIIDKITALKKYHPTCKDLYEEYNTAINDALYILEQQTPTPETLLPHVLDSMCKQ